MEALIQYRYCFFLSNISGAVGFLFWWQGREKHMGWRVEGLYCKRPCNTMSGVFQNIDPPPHRPASVSPVFRAGWGHTRWVERVSRVNSSEDARHSSVIFICKYFVGWRYREIFRCCCCRFTTSGMNSENENVKDFFHRHTYNRVRVSSLSCHLKGLGHKIETKYFDKNWYF